MVWKWMQSWWCVVVVMEELCKMVLYVRRQSDEMRVGGVLLW